MIVGINFSPLVSPVEAITENWNFLEFCPKSVQLSGIGLFARSGFAVW